MNKYKKLILVLLTFISINLFGQSDSFKVKEGSFHKVSGCLTIPAHTDQNNLPMAVIKIITENINEQERTKLYFEGNLATDIEVEQHIGETWVYVTAKAVTFLRIKHPDFGVTEFNIPMEIDANQCYEMVLQYIPIQNNQIKPQNNFISIITDQNYADIYIDDNYVGQGKAYKSFPIGSTHTWRIECNLYHSESGRITITDKDNIIERKLRSAYGYLNINSLPEEGALVYINNKKVGITPYVSDKLPSGIYNVKVVKEMFNVVEQSFEVVDGNTTNARLNMVANFVDVTIQTDSDSDIYIDDEVKGKGTWTGRLSAGTHLVEAKKPSHKTSSMEINLLLGKSETIVIDNPEPIYGYLEMQAEIYIDGKNVGKTPKLITDILVGTHEVMLKIQGYATLVKTIDISKNETLKLKENLQNGKEITISTDKTGDKIYIDDNYVGFSPIKVNIAYANHKIRVERNDRIIEKVIDISAIYNNDYILVSFYEPLTFTVNNVSFTMIAIEGGKFDMGSNYFESDNDERIIHNVSLDDFYIGETEVTQELWEAVMGTNIGNQKDKSSYGTKLRGAGKDFPMYYVNWYEAKEFCDILSKMTGKTFRLPTEAEWEYAARGGNKSNDYKYSGSNSLYEEAWYYDNSNNQTHIVKTKKPNELGIYDMSGNVWEWCEDWYADYSSDSQQNPTGSLSGTYKVIRGGSWSYGDDDCRIHNRYSNLPNYRYDDYGFRIVMVP